MNITSNFLLCGLLLQLSTLSATALAPNTNSLNTVIQQLNNKVTITGHVTSAQTKLPLAGVTINLKGSSLAAITDSNGSFFLEIADPTTSTIVFSHENYDQQEVKVGNQSVITISLSETKLVTTALGIKRKAESLSYALTEIKGDELTNVAQENFLNSLAGRVAGLSISQTSGIGSSVNVVLRGFKSLSNDNQPLYVVDGVPMVSPLNNVADRGVTVDYGSMISDINPEDIESIAVLKGAAAAALYGYRAGNGAILITTKSGQKGKAIRVNFSTSNLIEKPYRFLDYHYKLANGFRSDQLNEESAYWAGPELDKGIKAIQWNSPLDENGNPIPTELKSYKNNVKNFVQSPITTVHNLSVSGATTKISYRAGFNMMKNQGLIPDSDIYRNGITTSFQYQPLKTLKISTNLNFVRAGSGSNPSTTAIYNPIEAAYDYSHVDVQELRNYWLPGQEEVKQLMVAPNMDNPYFLAKGINNSHERDRYFGNFKIDWQILRSLSIYVRVTHNKTSEKRESKIPYSFFHANTGGYFLDKLKNKETIIESMLSYQKKISHFDLVVSGGGNHITTTDNVFSIGGYGLVVPGLYQSTNIGGYGPSFLIYEDKRTIYSAFGTGYLGFKQQIFLDLAARQDWHKAPGAVVSTSQLSPSAGLSWLANRSFKVPNIISLLKFRASWAKTGTGTQFYKLLPIQLINNNIVTSLEMIPEVINSMEYGVDIALFQNKLRFEATYFNSIIKSRNSVNGPYETNSSSINFPSKFKSNGLELSLNATPLADKNGWTIQSGFNWSHYKTKLVSSDVQYLSLWDLNGGGSNTLIDGYIGDLYSRGYSKVEDPQSPYYQWPILTSYGQLQGSNQFDKREKVGNFNPKFLLGGQLCVSYKQFSLAASFDWRNGGQFISYTYRMAGIRAKSDKLINAFPGGNYSTEELAQILKSNPEKYIIPSKGSFPIVGGASQETGGYLTSYGFYDGTFIPGVQLNPDGSYKEYLGGTGTDYTPISGAYPRNFDSQVTFDADFVKLRELALSYSVKKLSWFETIQFSIYTRNIMLWTKAKIGIDPERAYQNVSGTFRQGIEYQNINPWTIPIGFKIGITI